MLSQGSAQLAQVSSLAAALRQVSQEDGKIKSAAQPSLMVRLYN